MDCLVELILTVFSDVILVVLWKGLVLLGRLLRGIYAGTCWLSRRLTRAFASPIPRAIARIRPVRRRTSTP